MEKFYRKPPKAFSRESIIGLGEASIRKNYYPELQEKLDDVERLNNRNRGLIMTIPDSLFICDRKGQLTPMNYSRGEEEDISLTIIRNRGIHKELVSLARDVTYSTGCLTHNFQMQEHEKIYYFEARLIRIEAEEVLIMVRDMTDRTLLEMQLRDMAVRDALTKLYNRHYFEEILATAEREAYTHFAIIMVDIDGLKVVNDTLGHQAGDKLIRETAILISNCFPVHSSISRIGGDEFGIVLLDTTVKEIEERLNQLSERTHQLNQAGHTIEISLSYGYSYHGEGPTEIKWIYQEADNNMYQNKLLKSASIKNNLVKTLMKALEAKDFITEGHADRLEYFATKLGKVLNLPQNTIDRIQLLTKFHDIGKVGIPDEILKKPGPLTEDEWKIMRTHCTIGERIANESHELKEIAPLILRHHERYDGKGYPLGLSGEDIPIECRILTLVDSFDAMTNDRPYRKALPIPIAVEELIRYKNTQFDGFLTDLLLELIQQEEDTKSNTH